MAKIQWTNLPPALRRHLFDRLEDRKITVEDLYQLKLSGANPSQKRLTACGTRISAPSKSAVKASSQRPSCLRAKHPKGNLSSSLCVLCASAVNFFPPPACLASPLDQR